MINPRLLMKVLLKEGLPHGLWGSGGCVAHCSCAVVWVFYLDRNPRALPQRCM